MTTTPTSPGTTTGSRTDSERRTFSGQSAGK